MSGDKVVYAKFRSLTPEENDRLEAYTRATHDLGSRVASMHSDVTAIKNQLPDLKKEMGALGTSVNNSVAAVVSLSKQINASLAGRSLPPARPEARSYHGFDGILADAGDVLARRVKDPKDPLSEERAHEIAAEVFARLGEAKDAHSFRAIKRSGKAVAFEIAKYAAVGIVGALGYYLKTKLGL